MNDLDFILIQSWMLNELGLTGNKLLVYAIIYSFTHGTKEHFFKGGSRYLMEATNASKRSVFDSLKALCDMGVVEKETGEFEGVPYVWYRTAALPVQKLHRGSAETAHKKEIGNKEGISTLFHSEYKYSSFNNVSIPKKTTKNIDFDLIISRFNEICKSLPKCKKLTDSRKASIKARWEEYGEDIFTAFEKAEASDFLSGRSGGWNGANLDWILCPSNMIKIMEGNYDNERFRPKVQTTIYRDVKASRDSDMSTERKSESIEF